MLNQTLTFYNMTNVPNYKFDLTVNVIPKTTSLKRTEKICQSDIIYRY